MPPPGQKQIRDEDDEDLSANDDEEQDEPAVDENRTDFQIEFARDLLAQAKTSRRQDLVTSSKAFFDRVRNDEDKKLTAALDKLSVDWSPGAASGSAGQLQMSLQQVGGDVKVAAGTAVKVRGTVKNLGTATVHRAHAILKSDNMLFDENELAFGKIPPGATKTYELTVKVPKNSLTRTDVIRADLLAQGSVKANSAEMMLHIEGKQRPQFAYTYQTIDDVSGNKDGLVQRGEKVRLLMKVKNIGHGASLKTEAILRNGPGQEGILISAGRFDAKELAPGAVKPILVRLRGGAGVPGRRVPAGARGGRHHPGRVGDRQDQGEGGAERAGFAGGHGRGDGEDQRSGVARIAGRGRFDRGPRAQGSGLQGHRQGGPFERVELEANRSAFIASADVQAGGTVQGAFKPQWHVTPPVLTVTAPTVVNGNSVHIKGVATDDREIKDVYVRVWNRDSKLPPKKVFYQPNRSDKNKLNFEADVPLWPGSNLVQVFARETNEIQSVSTVVVLDAAARATCRRRRALRIASPSAGGQMRAGGLGPPRGPPHGIDRRGECVGAVQARASGC